LRPTVRVRVLYFGIVRERLRLREESYELPLGARVQDLLAAAEKLHAPLSAGVASIRVAVNAEYVDSNHALSDNDEVAIIPPVSGGC